MYIEKDKMKKNVCLKKDFCFFAMSMALLSSVKLGAMSKPCEHRRVFFERIPFKAASCDEASSCDEGVDSVPTLLMKNSRAKAYENIDFSQLVRYVCAYVKEYGEVAVGGILYGGLRPPALVFDDIERFAITPSEWVLKLYHQARVVGGFTCFFYC